MLLTFNKPQLMYSKNKSANIQLTLKNLETRIVEKINATIEQVQGNTGTLINEAIALQIATTDFQRAITDSVGTIVADRLNEFVFPANSINASALQTGNLGIKLATIL
jgi:hypothetical protein